MSFESLPPANHSGAGRLLPSLYLPAPPPSPRSAPAPARPQPPPSSLAPLPRRHDPDSLYSAAFPGLTPTTSTSTARPPPLARLRRPQGTCSVDLACSDLRPPCPGSTPAPATSTSPHLPALLRHHLALLRRPGHALLRDRLQPRRCSVVCVVV